MLNDKDLVERGGRDGQGMTEEKKKQQRVQRKRELWASFYIPAPSPFFLQTQTIATLCHCERTRGHCLCFPQAGSRAFLGAAPSQSAAKEEELQSNQSPRMYQPLICFQDDPSCAHTSPKSYCFPTPSLHSQCCLPFPGSPPAPPPLPSCRLHTLSPPSLPALSVMQLVALKVWGVIGGGSGSLPSTPKYAPLCTHAHKRLLPNKKHSASHLLMLQTHAAQAQRPTPERISYGNSSFSQSMVIIGLNKAELFPR